MRPRHHAAEAYCSSRSTRMPTYGTAATSPRGYQRSTPYGYTLRGAMLLAPNVAPRMRPRHHAADAHCSSRSTRMLRTVLPPHLLRTTSADHPLQIQARGIHSARGIELMTRAPAMTAATHRKSLSARNISAPRSTSAQGRRAAHTSERRTAYLWTARFGVTALCGYIGLLDHMFPCLCRQYVARGWLRWFCCRDGRGVWL